MGIGRAIEDWTYGGDPSGNQVDRVRMLVGDTDESSKLITDSEIEYYISISGDDFEAAWRTALGIRAWAARLISKSGGGMTEGRDKVFKHYTDLAETLLAQAPMAVPRAPQLRRADRDAMRADTTLIQPQFSVGMLSEDADAIRPSSNDVDVDDILE